MRRVGTRSRLVAIVSLVLALGPAPARTAGATDELVVYLWGRPAVDDPERVAEALAAAGFTVVDATADELDVLERHGLRAMIHDPTPELAARLRDHPAVWGYHCADEPYPEETFPELAALVRSLEAADPHHPAFVNVLSTTGRFLRTYLRPVRPPLLSFDYYQWWWGSDRYYEKLEEFREQAVLAGIPLGSCVEVTANPAVERGDTTYLIDNARKLRQSVYASLAYGATMIEWFSARHLFEDGTTELTPAGRDVAALNAELGRVGPQLVGLRSLGVFHTPPLPLGTREAPKEHWVRLVGEPSRDGLLYGLFDDEAGLDYLLVVNRDYRDAQSVVVRLQSRWLGIAPWHEPKKYEYGIEVLDKATGAWTTLSSTSFVGFTFVVGPGDGELFRVTTRVLP